MSSYFPFAGVRRFSPRGVRNRSAKADGFARSLAGDFPFSVGTGGCRFPAGCAPPFVVGSNCAIFGTPCGGGHPSYRSVAPLHTVAALRFPAPSGPPIAPLPRNRLAFSAAGGASPLSSSPQNPLRWAFVGCPIRLRRKEKAPFDGVREKGSGGGIPDFVRNARSACDGGLARQSSEVLPSVSALDRNGTPGPARMLCRSLFAAAPWHSRKRSRPHCQSSATTGLRQQKRGRERPGAPPTYGTAMHG